MKCLLAIDPGTDKSAAIIIDRGCIVRSGIVENKCVIDEFMRSILDDIECHLAIEMVACYGMPVGREVFETCVWIGRFIEAWDPKPHTKVYRRDVKLHLCNSARAKDGNVRQALLDRYPRTGGGKTPQVGTKSCRGGLYGIKSHLWSALAVATYWNDTYGKQQEMKE